jgi:hypothetical protein
VLQATRRHSYRASQAARARMVHGRQPTADKSGSDTSTRPVSRGTTRREYGFLPGPRCASRPNDATNGSP